MKISKKSAILVIIAIMALFLILFWPIGPIRIRLDLPPATTTAPKEQPLCIEIREPGDYYIRQRKTSIVTLVDDLEKEAAGKTLKDQRILISADETVPYEEFIVVLNTLQARGIYKIGLINIDPDEKTGCN